MMSAALQPPSPSTMTVRESIWDEMAEGRNLKVEHVTANDTTATYRVSFDLVLGRDKQHALSRFAGFQKRGVTKLIAKYARFGLKLFFSDDDDSTAASARPMSESITEPPSI